MTTKELHDEILRYCRENTNPVIVEKYRRYFKEGGYDAYGLAANMTTLKAKELIARPGMTLELALATAPLLLVSPKYEETSFAMVLVLQYSKTWTIGTFEAIETWFSMGINNWAHTDFLCGEILSLFFKRRIISMDSLSSWRTASNKYQRRAAVVGLIKPMKLSADFGPYLQFIDPMMTDPAREVHQGLGWFLREAWKKQPAPVEAFLLKWKDVSPRLIFQYATEKMTPDQKERFRKKR